MWTSAQFFRLLPTVFSMTAFLLSMLALFAGNQPGILEGYDIITIDTYSRCENVGTELTASSHLPARAANDDCDGVGSLLSGVCNSMNSAAAGALPSPTPTAVPLLPPPAPGHQDDSDVDEYSDRETKKPRNRSYYSLYALKICECGTMSDGTSHLTKCYPYFSKDLFTISILSSASCASADSAYTLPTYHAHFTTPTTITAVEPQPSSSGDASGNGGLHYALQFTVDNLIALLKTVAALLSIGIGLTGLAACSTIPASSLGAEEAAEEPKKQHQYSWAVWFNLACSSAATLFLLLGAMVGAVGAKVAEGTVNELGGNYSRKKVIGVSAAAGRKWVAMAWAAVALMVAVVVYWGVKGARWRNTLKEQKKRMKEDEENEARERYADERVAEMVRRMREEEQQSKV